MHLSPDPLCAQTPSNAGVATGSSPILRGMLDSLTHPRKVGNWFPDSTEINPSDYGSGSWFGVRPQLEDYGFKFGGQFAQSFYGIVDGGLSRQGSFNEQMRFSALVDFEKLLHIPGLTGSISARWRSGPNPNNFAGASNTFNPSGWQGGLGWRLMPIHLNWQSGNLLFGVKNFLSISAGWGDPYFLFGQDALANMFVDNAFKTKGLGSNGIAYAGSYAAWGGTIKIRPTETYYLQAGLYGAWPDGTKTGNHGLAFSGYAPDPGQNGLYALMETGFTPKFGPDELSGKYAFGAVYWGVPNTSFDGGYNRGRYCLYWQLDQMLYRRPPPPNKDSPEIEGERGRAVENETSSLGDQGLYWFSWFDYSPPYNSAIPFYFQTGLVYKGITPGRDLDQIIIGFGYGGHSGDQISAKEAAGEAAQFYESVLEAGYRIQVTKWAYLQPYIQYLIQPGGTGHTPNATVMGFTTAINF